MGRVRHPTYADGVHVDGHVLILSQASFSEYPINFWSASFQSPRTLSTPYIRCGSTTPQAFAVIVSYWLPPAVHHLSLHARRVRALGLSIFSFVVVDKRGYRLLIATIAASSSFPGFQSIPCPSRIPSESAFESKNIPPWLPRKLQTLRLTVSSRPRANELASTSSNRSSATY